MNFFNHRLAPGGGGKAKPPGFTLAEMMVAMAVFSLATVALVGVQIFGLKVYTLSSTKLIATTGGRQLMDKLRDPIRTGNTVIVGSYENSFLAIPDGSLQIGNALLISLAANSVNTNNFIVFYHDAATGSLRSVNNNVTTVLANSITNDLCFQAEDWRGNVLSSYINNPVIRVDLGFIQWNFGGGTSGYYNLYHLQTRVARRPK